MLSRRRSLLLLRLLVLLSALGGSFFLANWSVVQAGTLSSISVTKSGGGYPDAGETATLDVVFTTATDVPIGGFIGIYLPSGYAFAGADNLSLSNLAVDGADPGAFSFVETYSPATSDSIRLTDVHLMLKTQGAVLSAGSTLSFALASVTVGGSCQANRDGWVATYESDGSTFIDGGWVNNETGYFTFVVCTPAVMGKLVDPDGAAVADQYVSLRSRDWSTYRSVQTDSEGYFYFFSLGQSSDMVLEAYAPTGVTYFDISPVLFDVPAPVSQPYNHGDVAFTRASILGKVYNPDGVTPLQGANIYVHDGSWSVSKWAGSESDGSFRLGGLGTGAYTMEFSSPWDSEGLVPPDGVSVSTIQGITVYYDGNSGHNGAIVFEQAKKTVTGTVKKPNGVAVTNARVEAYKENGSGWAQTGTDSQGQYTLSVGGGRWMLNVWPDYNGDSSSVDWTYNKGSTRVSFSNDNTAVESQAINFIVQVADCIIQGRITDPNGEVTSEITSYTSVNAWSKDNEAGGGGGNSGIIQPDGTFNFRVPSGTYELSIEHWGSAYGSPAQQKIVVEDADGNGNCDGKNVGTVKLLARSSTITGTVKDNNGQGVGDIWINAWKYEGGGWADATTGSTGAYSLPVTAGTWVVSISTDSGMMDGGYNEQQTTYIYDGVPVQVTVGDQEDSAGNNFTVKIADATISGRVVNNSGSTLTNLEMGYAFIETGTAGSGDGFGPMMYNTIGAPVNSGIFTLKVPAGTYNVNVSPPWGGGYCSSSSKEVTVGSGDTATVAITLDATDAVISGYLKNGSVDGETITGVWAEVFASSGSMDWISDNVNTNTGAYSLSVCAGDWHLGYWIDSSSADYMSEGMLDNKVTILSGETKTKNIVARKADATIRGVVVDPNGDSLSGVWVSVDTRSNDKVGGQFSRDEWFHNGSMTDSSGEYSIDIPSGTTYYVEAHLPPGLGLSYINPQRAPATPASGETVTVDLAFQEADATLTGQITQDEAARSAFVTGWSEGGGFSSTWANTGGNYTLSITSGNNWHIRAVYEAGTSCIRSREYVVSVGAGETSTQNIALTKSGTMPDSVTATFAATNQKTITLDDGTTINIPAGALASSGNVTVTVEPKAQLPSQSLASPLNFGYDITALDANGAEITSNFNSNVTITFPYSESDLTEFGISEDDLLAGYWDEASNTWHPARNISIDKDAHTVTITVNHLTDFSLFAAGTVDTSTEIVQATDSTLTPTPTPTSAVTPTESVSPTLTLAPTATTTPSPSVTPSLNATAIQLTATPTAAPLTSVVATLPQTGVGIGQASIFYLSRLAIVCGLIASLPTLSRLVQFLYAILRR